MQPRHGGRIGAPNRKNNRIRKPTFQRGNNSIGRDQDQLVQSLERVEEENKNLKDIIVRLVQPQEKKTKTNQKNSKNSKNLCRRKKNVIRKRQRSLNQNTVNDTQSLQRRKRRQELINQENKRNSESDGRVRSSKNLAPINRRNINNRRMRQSRNNNNGTSSIQKSPHRHQKTNKRRRKLKEDQENSSSPNIQMIFEEQKRMAEELDKLKIWERYQKYRIDKERYRRSQKKNIYDFNNLSYEEPVSKRCFYFENNNNNNNPTRKQLDPINHRHRQHHPQQENNENYHKNNRRNKKEINTFQEEINTLKSIIRKNLKGDALGMELLKKIGRRRGRDQQNSSCCENNDLPDIVIQKIYEENKRLKDQISLERKQKQSMRSEMMYLKRLLHKNQITYSPTTTSSKEEQLNQHQHHRQPKMKQRRPNPVILPVPVEIRKRRKMKEVNVSQELNKTLSTQQIQKMDDAFDIEIQKINMKKVKMRAHHPRKKRRRRKKEVEEEEEEDNKGSRKVKKIIPKREKTMMDDGSKRDGRGRTGKKE